ncbi:DUF835 domain-containing protein [Thermococcus sp.]
MPISIPDKVMFMSDLLNFVFILIVSVITLNYRGKFIERFPPLKRFYDLILFSFAIALVGNLLDVADDVEINGYYIKSTFLSQIESWLFAISIGIISIGWIVTLKTITSRKVEIPLVKLQDNKKHTVHVDPGLYLSTNDDACHTIFASLLRQRPGLVISRSPPDITRASIGIEEVPVLWITKVGGENTVHPTNLPYLLHTLVSFFEEGDMPKTVLLDGMEYLILENGFPAVFKFLTTLKDYALLTNSIVLMPVESRAHSEQELNMLLREFEIIS